MSSVEPLPKSYTLKPLYLRLLVAETFGGGDPRWVDDVPPVLMASLTEYALIRETERIRVQG